MSILERNREPSARQPAPPHPEIFPYETACFHQCWWEFLAPKFDIPVKSGDLLICRKPVLKGLIQLKEARISGWNNAWNQHLTEARAEELDTLAHTSRWDYFRMTWTESSRDRQAFERLTEKGYPMLKSSAPTQYAIDMRDGFDAYLKGLSHNSRKNLNKKARRAETLHPTLIPCESEAEIDGFFAEFFRHHVAYWDEKAGRSYFHDAEERNFIVNWAKTLHRSDGRSGLLVLDRLVMDGKTVNLSMGIRTGSSFYWLLTINTGLYAEYAPGIIGLRLRLEQLAAQGVTRFLMGAGNYFYKTQSANVQESCAELLVCNPRSIRGKAYFHWAARRAGSSVFL